MAKGLEYLAFDGQETGSLRVLLNIFVSTMCLSNNQQRINCGATVIANSLIGIVSPARRSRPRIRAGDTVLSIPINEIGNNSVTPIEFTVGATLTSTSQLVETKIVGILETVKTGITYFNGRSEARYSSQQPLFIKSDGEFQVKIVSNIKLGDALLLINPDGTYTKEETKKCRRV